jgi:uncharacterized membrane protein
MSNLVISIFENENQAEAVRTRLLATDRDGSLGLEDTATVEKTQQGEIRFHHLHNSPFAGAITGAAIGTLLGILILNPVFALGGFFLGLLIGAGIGAFSHIGIDTDFAKTQAEALTPGEAALLVQNVGEADRVLEEIQKFRGNIVQTKVCTKDRDLRHCRILSEPASLLDMRVVVL